MKTILISDPLVASSEQVKFLLQEKGFSVISELKNDLSELITSTKPSIVLLNLGQGEAKDLKPVEDILSLAHKPLIVGLVASADIDVHHQIIQAGCNLALEYPCSAGILVENIDQLYRQ